MTGFKWRVPGVGAHSPLLACKTHDNPTYRAKIKAYFAQMRINDKNLPADKRLCGLLGATYRWMLTQQPADLLFRRTVPLEGFFDCLTDKFHHGRIL